MNARSITIVVLAIAIGVGVGWYTGRASLSRQIDSLLNGNSRYVRALDSRLQNSMYDKSDGALLEGLKRKNVADVFYLYRHADDVNAFLSYKNLDDTAYDMAEELLLKMECDSADTYFSKFKEKYNYGSDSRYQEPGTEEHDSFRRFIESIVPGSAIKNEATNAE